MKRREFITLLGGATMSWPLGARAQQRPIPVIGFLHAGSLAVNRRYMPAFHEGLAEAGYVEGRNVAIEFRWANNQLDQLPALAADLVRLRPTVIVAAGALRSAFEAKRATSTIPIVLAGAAFDPIKEGFVASLNRPGGNVTGLILTQVGHLGRSEKCRLCCKSLFAPLIANFSSCRRGFRVNMWGTSSPGDKLTGDFGNEPDATSISDRGLFRLLAGNLSPGVFRLLQHNLP